MDVRALLAIVFLLWLIRAWVKWDLQEKNAQQSRLRLRDRLADSMLRERVGARREAQVSSDASSASSVAESLDEDEPFSSADRKELLLVQLKTLEAQARAARQSDLELRRLRSEVESIQSEGFHDRPDIDALEQRVREQQAALAKNIENLEVATEDELSQHAASDSGDQNKGSSAAQNPDDSEVGTAKKTPLYQAPSEKDDLKKIKGIGPVMEQTLNELGVTTFRQLANFTQDDIDKVSEAIGAFSGRIERDNWVGKAQEFVRNESSV